MKLKYYLRGLGVGILFSTIILSISFNAALKEKTKEVKSNTDNTDAINSDEEIDDLEDLLIPTVEPTAEPTKEPAKNEEKTDPSNEEPSVTPTKSPTEEQTDETETSTETQTEAPTATPTPTPTPTVTEESSNPGSEVDKKEEKNNSNEDNKVTKETDKEVVSKEKNKDSQDHIIINIKKGMSSEEVALILENYGIIENDKDFNNFLKDNGYSTNIKVGDFKISKNATYEQIANLIVKK